MTTDISEDVMLHISSPQILTTSLNNESNTQASILEYVQTSQPESGAGAAPRGGAHSGSVELGRRLLLAARHGQTALVLDLMARGAPFTTDWLGTSPLHLAASHAHADTCAVLLRAGVSRDSRTKVERTPLHLAAHAGHAAVAALLLEHGALVDCRDMLRMTPLHWAAERGHGAVAAVLLRHGADPRAASKFHKTPLALAARRHPALLRQLEDALREREAARSVDALREATEEMMEIPAAEQQQALESIERLQETVKPPNKQPSVHTEPIKIELERPPEGGAGAGGGAAGGGAALAAALLRKHGITLLPHDDTSTVLNAIQSGRTVVLSDAGKLMLKESSDPRTATPAPAPPPPPPPPSKGVILTAAPVKSPPKPGVKIFTLNNKLLAMPKENKVPVKKISNPQDMQIKLVHPPSQAAGGGRVARARARPVRLVVHGAAAPRPRAGGALQRAASTTVTPTSELTKFLHSSTVVPAATSSLPATCLGGAGSGDGAENAEGGDSAEGGDGAGGGVLCVPAEFLSSTSTQYLRAQLLSAHHTIQELRRELAALQRRRAAPSTL